MGLQGISLQRWKMFYTHAVVLKITLNYLFILDNRYKPFNDILNQRIPQYGQDYNGIH